MAFERPTLTELVDRIQEDFVSRLDLAGAVLRRSVVRVLARVLAGAAHMLHGHLVHLSEQVFPDRSEAENLTRQAELFGLSRRAAEFAAGDVVVHGTNGTVIPIDAVLLRPDGEEYSCDAEVTVTTLAAWAPATAYAVGDLRSNDGNIYQCSVAGVSAGAGGPTGAGTAIVDGAATWRYVAAGSAAVSAAVTAVIAGAEGNEDVGVALSFESPIAGANATAPVAVGGLVNGSDEESDELLRGRLLDRMRAPPHGGNEADYVAWALEVAGVTRAWVYPLELGPGTVTVRFVRDEDASIIPDAGEVAAVQAHLDELRPVTAGLTVVAPTDAPIAFTIHIVPDNATTRAAVQAALEDLLVRESEPGGTILRSQIDIAVGISEGVTDFAVTAPAADVVNATGAMSTVGVITWV